MPPKNAGGRKKAANGYQMPAPVPLGTVLTDMAKRQWKVGPSIGSGGFGEIYCACEASSGTKRTDDYPYVVKIVSAERVGICGLLFGYVWHRQSDGIYTF